MCGIVAVVRDPRPVPAPSAESVLEPLTRAAAAMDEATGLELGAAKLAGIALAAASGVEEADRALQGSQGVAALLAAPRLAFDVASAVERMQTRLDRLDAETDAAGDRLADEMENVNAALVRLRDALWALGKDRLGTADGVRELAGPAPSREAIDVYWSIQVALSALDRLEVRGRDSAGLSVLVWDHGLDASDAAGRRDPLFRSGAVLCEANVWCFSYKASAEIGELGDNTTRLRASIRGDELLRRAVARGKATVLGHTRWASVGVISEANAHPLCSDGPELVVAALNGDVDNYAALASLERLGIPSEITTDAKVIPMLVAKRLSEGFDDLEAFRRTVSSFEGSVAVAAVSARSPGSVSVALRGSGQALYVGMAEGAFVVASEPYGVIEQAPVSLRMDGETPADPAHPATTRGQIVVLDASGAGTTSALRRYAYDGRELAVAESEPAGLHVTTRDVDRAGYRHYLMKEIAQSPRSLRKTLRGKIVRRDGRLTVWLPEQTMPGRIRARLSNGAIRRFVVIGQGTAAVAAKATAAALAEATGRRVDAEAMTASELSGFRLGADMSDTLVVAISQSGTTTDTNRTVDLARTRGASVICIVNRRGSDLVHRCDGVLFISDGRDVEVAVPSTKAFYGQVAAGILLAFAIAAELGLADPGHCHEVLSALRELPESMAAVLESRDRIEAVARRWCTARRYWAVVGSGNDRIAAEEVRIKLSELCYKSISCDAIEDKKHIDLSSEPLILVCAAGLGGSNAQDVAKEVAIYRAHKATPIVVASQGTEFPAALDTITVPPTHPSLAFILCAVAGHIFGYAAALAIDEQARPLREMRAAVEASLAGHPASILERLAPMAAGPASVFRRGLAAGDYDGHLEASTATRIASLLRFAVDGAALEGYEAEAGKPGSPVVVVQDLTTALSRGIDELTRTIDTIKHQAKTVTVGISRADEGHLSVPLVRQVLAAGAPRERLSYPVLATLAVLDAAVTEVAGYTRYEIEGQNIRVVDKGGIAADMTSRTERDPVLKGTKRRVATEREALVVRGRSDGRPVLIVPEVAAGVTTGITLLHVRFAGRLAPATAREVLSGYRDRYSQLVDAVTETEPAFDDEMLGRLGVAELLTEPVHLLAENWRRP